MSCPQGLTLSGKMCTVAPILSCPSGYTLVNGMCQQDDGLQGFGDSMNIPPSENRMMYAGDVNGGGAMPTPSPSMSPEPMGSIMGGGDVLKNIASDLGGMLKENIPVLPGQEQAQAQRMPMQMQSPQPQPQNLRPMRPTTVSPLPTTMMPPTQMSPSIVQPRQRSPTRRMAGSPPPQRPTLPSSSPSPMRPPNNTRECPMGYSFNDSDRMCYPL